MRKISQEKKNTPNAWIKHSRLINVTKLLKPLHPRINIHINPFPMPDAKNPYLGLDHFEHDPVITNTELPVAFQ
jgi:hypothetical protein